MALSIRPHIRRLFTESAVAFPEFRNFPILEKPNQGLHQETHPNVCPDTFEFNFRLKELVKAGHLNDARSLFEEMPRRDEISWTTMMSGYVNSNSKCSEALSLFTILRLDPSVQVDRFLLSKALQACGLDRNASFGEALHGYSVKTGLISSVFVGSSLLDMYTKIMKIREGCRVFDEMPIRNVVTWTAIITGLVHSGYNREGLVYFSEMSKSNVDYDSYTYAIALKACTGLGAFNFGRAIHTRTMKKGFDVSSFVANNLATLYNKCGKSQYGLRLFENMTAKDVVSWTTMITSNVQMGQEARAIEKFMQMRKLGVDPNEYTFAAILSGCANILRLDWGKQLHCHVFIMGFMGFSSVSNSIMCLYSNNGRLASASMIFHEMMDRDIVSWSTIIKGYAQGGRGKEAFEMLSCMRREGPKPNEFALSSVLSICGSMTILEQGKQLHAHVLSVGLDATSMIQSALINMYSKCGSIEEASRIYSVAKENDTVVWTAMINGYAEHGFSHEAINLFETKSSLGLKPDPVTFIGVLSACNHAGLVDHGYHYFNTMSNDHHISPLKEHYGCMVDLLCRAGRLTDAERMIRSMPYERDDVVWSTLLRACRIHGDVDCGRRAAEQVLALEPDCAGTHITLANIYSSKGWWREAADVRKLMRSRGVIKEPGWSWVKIKDQISAFVAGDRSHEQTEDIYSVLSLVASTPEMADKPLEVDSTLYDEDMVMA